jgi:hypothetical protein
MKSGVDTLTLRANVEQPSNLNRRERARTVSATPRNASTVLADKVDDDRVRSIGTRFRGGRMYEATQSRR